jgi:hypothetical protein
MHFMVVCLRPQQPLRQHRSKPETRLVHLGLRGAFRDPEDFADFPVLEPLDVVQHEGRAAPFGQPRHRPFEIHLRHRLLGEAAGPISRLVERRLVVQRIGQLGGAGGAASQVIQALVRGQPVQPRPERRLAAKTVQLAVRRQKYLLQQVLGVLRVAQHPARDAEQLAGMGPVQLLEGGQISAAAPLDERHVLRPRGGVRHAAGGLTCRFRRIHGGAALPAVAN